MTEESREVAKAREAVIRDFYGISFTPEVRAAKLARLERLVAAVRKDERERAYRDVSEWGGLVPAGLAAPPEGGTEG